MNHFDFSKMPDPARVYVYAASRPLSRNESQELLSIIDHFLTDWQAHGQGLAAARDWRYDRFLFIGVDESRTQVSGCSTDELTRILKALEARFDFRLIDNSAVLYREGDEIRRVTRREFSELVRTGRVTPETVVFNNTVSTMADLKSGRWELPFRNSWHSRAFGPSAAMMENE